MPAACRLSQTLGGSSLIFQASQNAIRLFGRCQPWRFCSRRHVGARLSATSISDCPFRFAGGQRSALGLPSVFGSRSGASNDQAWAFHANQVAGFGQEVWAAHAAVSERFTALPVSQRLKPQSSMLARFCISPFASAAQRVCRSTGTQDRRASARVLSSRQERVGSHQPPNPSFKRTYLRHAA
jgi:hypothetical protein